MKRQYRRFILDKKCYLHSKKGSFSMLENIVPHITFLPRGGGYWYKIENRTRRIKII
jgi:hypothetical protein